LWLVGWTDSGSNKLLWWKSLDAPAYFGDVSAMI
jgi:hypothetical protein